MRNMLTCRGFIDKTPLKTNTARTTGWSHCGARPVDLVAFGHQSTQAAATLNNIGTWFLFPPTCSPDLNPIEINRAFPWTMYGWLLRGKGFSGDAGVISAAALYAASDLLQDRCAP